MFHKTNGLATLPSPELGMVFTCIGYCFRFYAGVVLAIDSQTSLPDFILPLSQSNRFPHIRKTITITTNLKYHSMQSREEREKIHDRLLALLPEVREEMQKIPGVAGVSVGLREVGGVLTEEIVFQVLVNEKKGPHELQPADLIPKEIRGVKTDVQKILRHAVPRLKVEVRGDDLPHHTDEDPMTAGIMVGFDNTQGTLGCFAHLKDDMSQLVMLSNHHVLAAGRPDGAMVGQPYYMEGCCCCCAYPVNHTGYLLGEGIKDRKVDCAIATINSGIKHKNIISNKLSRKRTDPAERELHVKGIQKALSGDIVVKIGCISGYTKGQITSIAYPVKDKEGKDYMDDQITITPILNDPYICPDDLLPAFSDHGDSGSAVLDIKTGKVVALLWGGDPDLVDPNKPTSRQVDTTFATHIDAVLKALEEKGYPIVIEEYSETSAAAVRVERAAPSLMATPASPASEFMQRLKKTGSKWIELAEKHRTEVMHLINNDRAVGVAWQRNHGPAFTAHIAKSAQDASYTIPKKIKGASFQQLLIRMGAVLKEKGSKALQADIEKHTLEVLGRAETFSSVEELFTKLDEPVFA